MHHIHSLIICAIILTTALCSRAQQSSFNGWLMYLNSTKINKKFSLHFDGQFRSNAQVKQVQTVILRPGINVALKQNLAGTLGYAFVESRRAAGNVTGLAPEHRIWEQLLFHHPLGFTRLSHRLRLEQRFISNVFVRNNSLDHQGNVFANRLRYFFRDVIPFSGKKQFSKGYFAGIQNEIFINIGDKSPVNRKYFDQNRAYISLGYRFNPKFDLDAGYLNQYITGRGNLFTNNHVLQLAIYQRL